MCRAHFRLPTLVRPLLLLLLLQKGRLVMLPLLRPGAASAFWVDSLQVALLSNGFFVGDEDVRVRARACVRACVPACSDKSCVPNKKGP